MDPRFRGDNSLGYMKPTHHVIISGGVTAVFSIWVKSWGALAACFLCGIFIDLDHHIDYFLTTGKITLSYQKLVSFFHDHERPKVYLFFHSYELQALLWASIFLFDLNAVWMGAAIGLSTHMVCDEFANPIKPMAYFFTFRATKGFEGRYLFKKSAVHPS